MKENIITRRITSTPERSADTASLRPLSACSYLLSSTLGIAASLTNNRPVPGKTMVGAIHDRPKHIRDCRANKNVEAERRRVVKDRQKQSSSRELITKEVGLYGR
jgi:hypothetical protein